MKLTAGCDVGSLTTKVVVMGEKRIMGSALIKSGSRPEVSARQAMDLALEQAGVSESEIGCIVGTGYGREKITFVSKTKSEISCHAKGANWLIPGVKTIIDIGGQDCKVIRIDDKGEVVRFVTNDKCASGTGRFLEVMARVLDIDVSELGEQNRKATSPVTLASTCTVWAQADVVKYIHSGIPIEDIGAGINLAMAKRVATLVNSVKPEKEICMTGGVAKNKGVTSLMENLLGLRLKKVRRGDPQLAGALGAALIAQNGI
jgi:(R)-2-hydroxyacyl-CoA dehydratese activating ATPase